MDDQTKTDLAAALDEAEAQCLISASKPTPWSDQHAALALRALRTVRSTLVEAGILPSTGA